jgi:hypothetical protein
MMMVLPVPPTIISARQDWTGTCHCEIFCLCSKRRWSLLQLPEDDFDFELVSPSERRHLELQEIVIPGKKRGLPYAAEQQVIRPQRFAATILSGIRTKASKYPSNLSKPVDLFIYNTHWRFLPNKVVLQFVSHDLEKITHLFSRVFFFILSLFRQRATSSKGLNQKTSGPIGMLTLIQAAASYQDGAKVGVRFNLSPGAVQKFLHDP